MSLFPINSLEDLTEDGLKVLAHMVEQERERRQDEEDDEELEGAI